jgi:hypothetical protein
VAAEILAALHEHVRANRLGHVVSEVGFVLRRNPDTVRGPDVAFVRAGREPGGDDAQRFFAGAPDVAAEVVSPGDTAWEVAEKVEEYLAAGTSLVWVVDPKNSLVVVHTPDHVARVLRAGDTLDGGDVVPASACRSPSCSPSPEPPPMRRLLASLTIVALPAAAQRAPTPPPDFDAFVARVLQTFDVPGAAVAIVKDGRVVLAKGYGVRALGRRRPSTRTRASASRRTRRRSRRRRWRCSSRRASSRGTRR